VFEDRHRLIAELARKEDVIGLRVDHVDGLHDPTRYLERLQSATATTDASRGTAKRYLVVEKILGRDESLPGDWPVAGTTGYDFLNVVNGLFVDPDGSRRLDKDFRRFTGCDTSYAELSRSKNKQVIYQLLPANWLALLIYWQSWRRRTVTREIFLTQS